MFTFTMSLFVKEVESNGFYGVVSLRSYFECGTGRFPKTNGDDDPGDPYVITRPRHLYNLSRLQGLGVFDEPVFFQLGLKGLAGDNSNKPLCYLDDTSSTTVPFLDMSDSTMEYEPIVAIGTEAVPFYGEFDGQGLEIKNLTVYADPEDAGLFGYTAHGSKIHDLFLSNVTINSLGYTDTFANLYGPSSTVAVGTALTYNVQGEQPDTFTIADTEKMKNMDFDASVIFNWDGQGDEPLVNDPAPVIGFTTTNTTYRYKFLISGDFLAYGANNTVAIDLPSVYKFFKREKENTRNFPLKATSSVSLVASTTDNYGLDHSKVVMTLEFHFSLNSSTSNYLFMTANLADEHTNNIGLIAGHSDGSIIDCYVYNGKFEMNKGGAGYHAMTNGSNFGLIGLVGGTVHNIAAEESGAGTAVGKDIGVLDFTTVYEDIITPTSFNGSVSLSLGVTYVPSSSKMYADYLRKNNNNQYVTLATNTVSFNRNSVISNNDLGIFTVATDVGNNNGMGQYAGQYLDRSVVRWEDLSVSGSYYVYYATGEYNKTLGYPFSKYRDGIQQDTPEQFFPGYHFQNADQISTESFTQRDATQNYIIRFKVEGNSRTGRGFYFSDVDKTTPGGSFMSHYFENKLVDKEGHAILASANSDLSGVMLRNSLGQEIRSFSASFSTPDMSGAGFTMSCIKNADFDYPAANMVNFKVETNTANVTVIAGLTDLTRPAALGVWKVDNDILDKEGSPYVNRNYEDPDFAFFMPTDDHLAFFDYGLDANDKYQIGLYDQNGYVVPATTNTEAYMPSMHGVNADSRYASGKTRLYAHTFKLEPGQYCLGSATGTYRSGGNEGTAKIYYLCAQGQTDGNIQFVDNTFASEDQVQNIDFIKQERYTYNENTHQVTTNITMGDVTAYDPTDPRIDNQRVYVSFANTERSSFKAEACDITFVYEDNKFKISSTSTSSINHLVISNYGKTHPITGAVNSYIVLFGGDPTNENKLVYPPSQDVKEQTMKTLVKNIKKGELVYEKSIEQKTIFS